MSTKDIIVSLSFISVLFFLYVLSQTPVIGYVVIERGTIIAFRNWFWILLISGIFIRWLSKKK